MKPHDAYLKHITKNFETADELWNALSPTASLAKEWHAPVYRGQADAGWPLTPSVFRIDVMQRGQLLRRKRLESVYDLVWYESQLLGSMVKHCDESGQPILGDCQALRDELSTLERFCDDASSWPSYEITSFMAFAQHHGVPTRLLDWTTSPYTAAYFASSGAVEVFAKKMLEKQSIAEEKLAIWIADREVTYLNRRIKFITVPGATSPHLAAQSGLFSIHPVDDGDDEKFSVSGLETEFAKLTAPSLVKFTLPLSESGELLHLCNRAGISAAKIFPTSDGAGRAVIDDIYLGIVT